MRAGWKTITMNDACLQMNGIWKGTKAPLVPAKVLRTTNFSKDCRIKLDDLAIIDVEKKKLDARRLQRGDIIVEKSGGGPKQPVGRVILFDMDDDDYSFCNFTSALRIKDKEQLDYNYLHKYLTHLYFEGETEKYQSNLVGFRNLDFKGYVGIEVPYPSITEQQRIVDILDREFAKIDALKANAEASLQAAKDLFQATLKKELDPKEGWEVLAIPEVSENLDSKRVPITKSVRENGQYPYYGASGIVDYVADYIFDEPLLLVSEDGANLLARSTPIAFSVEGKVWVNNHAHVLRFDDYKKQKFVEYWFAGNDISSLITGTAQPKFNQKALNSIKIAFPVKQQEMEVILDRIGEIEEKSNALQENYQKTLALCDDLKQSLLRKAFNGAL